MLAVGRALMGKPRIPMLDEPGLTPKIVGEIRVVAALRTTSVATLLVGQNARAARQVADYGYVPEPGSVTLRGPAKEPAGNPNVIESYLVSSDGMRRDRGNAGASSKAHLSWSRSAGAGPDNR